MLSAGQTLERYVVEDYVGHGGMAVVYRARHAELGTKHALKVMIGARPAVRDRLLAEGRAQAVLRHPNVVGVTDVLRVDGGLALVMEYVDGPDLARWLARFDRATFDEARWLLRGVAAGLAEAHALGVTHRDLKPENVLLERTATGLRPKVADFGIAKSLDEGGLSRTRSNVAMGTPHYMAPEQVRDAASVDARADVFALGALLYEIVTGRLAFPGDDVLTVLNAVAEARYAPPTELVPDLPEDLARVIAGCLVVDRDARFQGCADVLAVVTGEVAPMVRGAELAASDWEDEAIRRARAEWLATGPPAGERVREGADDEVTAKLAPLPPPPPGRDELRVEVAPAARGGATVPRPPRRAREPATSQGLGALGVVRRVILSALIGTLLGMLAFMVIVKLTGWPFGQVTYAPPPPQAGLDQVVDPATPPP